VNSVANLKQHGISFLSVILELCTSGGLIMMCFFFLENGSNKFINPVLQA
jgi:hypothetical protein